MKRQRRKAAKDAKLHSLPPQPEYPSYDRRPDFELAPVALDCEMVGVGVKGRTSVVARVSIVGENGEKLLDTFVAPNKGEVVTDYRSKWSGVREENLIAPGREVVRKRVLELIQGRIVVGHDLGHDFQVLNITHPPHLIRDTAYYPPFHKNTRRHPNLRPSLKFLCATVLDRKIQGGEHDSFEDAKGAMDLYIKHRAMWEEKLGNRIAAIAEEPDSKELAGLRHCVVKSEFVLVRNAFDLHPVKTNRSS
ncbi:hypothetical protein BT69DRAFT_1213674 [Atractiella rhizophila]|nr:hypothetical protein BT69DRAFT_1213674 [Atractiella rhizophila]